MKRPPAKAVVAFFVALAIGGTTGCGWPVAAPNAPVRAAVERSAGPRIELAALFDLDSPPVSAPRRLLDRVIGRRAEHVLQRPYGVAWDGEDLLITDPGAGRVARIDPRGRVRLSPAGELLSPIGIARCRDGVVVTDSRAGEVLMLGTDLRLRSRLAVGLERPTGTVCLGDRVYVVETGRHRLLALDPDRDPAVIGARGITPGRFNFPAAIAIDGESLWVGDTLNFRVQRIDASSGGVLGSFGQLGDSPGDMPRLKGLAVDRERRVWVADAFLDRLAIYSERGEFLMDLGGPGREAGEFSFPAGMAGHPDGRVAVVDSLNRRVQVFRPIEPGGASR